MAVLISGLNSMIFANLITFIMNFLPLIIHFFFRERAAVQRNAQKKCNTTPNEKPPKHTAAKWRAAGRREKVGQVYTS